MIGLLFKRFKISNPSIMGLKLFWEDLRMRGCENSWLQVVQAWNRLPARPEAAGQDAQGVVEVTSPVLLRYSFGSRIEASIGGLF